MLSGIATGPESGRANPAGGGCTPSPLQLFTVLSTALCIF